MKMKNKIIQIIIVEEPEKFKLCLLFYTKKPFSRNHLYPCSLRASCTLIIHKQIISDICDEAQQFQTSCLGRL